MRNRFVLALAAGALVATGAVLAPNAAAEPARTIGWQPCPDAEGVDCATIQVPLDWSAPAGEKIEIGLARRPATDPARRRGAVLMDPGGPGGSGVRAVKFADPFTDAVDARFDQVGFDPRGINTSTQLRCDADLARQAAEAKHPASQADFDHLATVNRALHDSCRANSGGLAGHVDNIATVHDMDAIRAALGEEKLTFVGFSYGTLMGQQYAELYPHRVRALVLDGNMDHSLRTAWDFMRGETAPVEHAFVKFAKWCDTTPACVLHGHDTRAVYAELKEKARAGALVGPDGEPMDFHDLGGYAFGVTHPESWGELATALKNLNAGTPARAAFTADIQNISYPSIWCSDWQYPVRDYIHYRKLRDRLARHFPNVEWSPYVDHAMTCVGSGTTTTNPQRRLDIDDAPPLVMIGNVHDPATVYEWSRTAARQSGARLITYEGWGHTVYGPDATSPCVNAAVDAYLIDLTPPERGLTCPATEVPGQQQQRDERLAGPYGNRWTAPR